MTISIVRENRIAEGPEAWPIFQDSKELLFGRELSVLTIQARVENGISLDDAANLAVAELQRIVDSFAREKPLKVMLFAAHGAKQPNSRMALRRNLWLSLQNEYELPSFTHAHERLVYHANDGHRKAGVAILAREELEASASGLRRMRSAALLLVNCGRELDSVPLDRLFELAFGIDPPVGQVRWAQFIPGCLDLGFFPVRTIGEFDDRELTVDIFASRGLVDALAEVAS